jgi:hypothetical protein
VDVDGNSVSKNDTQEADMCEMIRALIYHDIIKAKTSDKMDNLNDEFIEFINCPGDPDIGL